MKVMEAGPWTFDNKTLVIQPWSPEVNLELEDLAIVPIWINFPHLKLHLWPISISKLASIIGKPLLADMMTAEKERTMFPRVYVEVKVGILCQILLP